MNQFSDNKKMLTVFTPTFNRKRLLPRLYKSLCEQTSYEFVWLVVDDGSTDGTDKLIHTWKDEEDRFEIRYLYKENGGMHTAHNLAYRNITSEINVCVDSDDMMPAKAVEYIVKFWKKNGSKRYAGFMAYDVYSDGRLIGSKFPSGVDAMTTIDFYQKYKGYGDKKFIYRTDVIKSVGEYPEYPGEKIVPLDYIYKRVDQRYKMLILHKPVCIVEYQDEGSSNNIKKQYVISPRGYADYKRLSMKCSIRFSYKVKETIHYIAECRIGKIKECVRKSPLKILTVFLYPVGMLAEFCIKIANKKAR